jgi:hypothetical protein
MILPDIVKLLDCRRHTTIPREKVRSGNAGRSNCRYFWNNTRRCFIIAARGEFHQQRRCLAATLRQRLARRRWFDLNARSADQNG